MPARLSDRLAWPAWHKGYAVLTCVAVVGVVMLSMIGCFAVALVFRRRFQFGIRSLLVLVVAVAVPCSWLAVGIEKGQGAKGSGGGDWKSVAEVEYDWEYEQENIRPFCRPPAQTMLRNLLGDDFFDDVVLVFYDLPYSPDEAVPFTDSCLVQVKELKRLKHLPLRQSQVTDAGLVHLAGLTQLQDLALDRTQVTDEGLAKLAGLSQLEELSLNNTRVTDAGLAHLRRSAETSDGVGKRHKSHRRRRRQTPAGPAQLQDHSLRCPPPVLDAVSISMNVRFAANMPHQELREGLGQMPARRRHFRPARH